MSSNPSHPMNGPRPRASSPPFLDRRQSYGGPPSRPSDNSYRPDEFSSRDVMREPPKGPKALETPRGGFGSRGRGGYFSRDRDPRDARDGTFHRRDGERDWSRRDNPDVRDRRNSPSNLDRSRSPNASQFRDTRDQVSREADSSRYAVNSRENLASASSSIPDGPQSASSFGRGSYRGRGRGDYPFRGRGRGFDDRERFAPRSRSRERAWTRDFRDDRIRDRDRDWDAERRDAEDRRHRDEPDHESERKREIVNFRSASRNSNASLHQPLTPNSGPTSTQIGSDRPTFRSANSQDELARPRHVNVSREDVITNAENHFQNSQAHQTSQSQGIQNHAQNAQNHSVIVHSQAQYAPEATQIDDLQAAKPDPITVAPRGPKASRQLSPQPPSSRRIDLHEKLPQQTGQDASSSRHDVNQGLRGVPQAPSSAVSSPPTSRFGVGQKPPISNRFSQTPFNTPLHPPRLNDQRLSSQPSSRLTYGEPTVSSGQNQSRQVSHQDTGDSSSRTPTKALGPSSHQTSPVATVPLGPKYNPAPVSIRQTSIAPVRPRGQASVPGVNGKFPSHNTWINPKLFHPHQPSILQTVPPTANHSAPQKRDYTGELKNSPVSEKPPTYTSSTSPSTLNEITQSSIKSPTPTPGTLVDQKFDFLPGRQESSYAEKDEGSPSTTLDGEPPVIDDLENSKAIDNPSDDEDGMELDEDYLAKGNEAYEKELRDLEAKRPPTPRHNKELLALLEEIDILASAADDLANGVYVAQSTVERKAYEKTEIGLLSPEPEIIEAPPMKINYPVDPFFGIPPGDDSSEDSASLGNLPYLQAGPPTPFSEIVSAQDSVFLQIRPNMVERLKTNKSDIHQEHERLRAVYKQMYRTWRTKNEGLDRQNKASNDSTIPDMSPAPVETPTITSTPVFESRGRVARFASELELQKVIQESKIIAEAAQSREKQLLDDQAAADLAKEAKIPEMLPPKDAAAFKFRDTNLIIKPEWVLKTFSFVQPQDDFTAEEHKLFTEEYLQYPKRWGKIAKAIPGRDYQACVLHYYLTKREANYKNQLAKKLSKKGKRPRQAPQRGPRSNALMSNMGGRNQILNSTEADSPQVPVTDTGRPRRAAAPTFEKAVAEAEQATTTPNVTRRGPNPNKSDATGNMTPEKPAAKRARTTQPKEKGTRKKNAQLLAAAPAPGPVPIKEADPQGLKMKEPKNEGGPRMTAQIEDAQLLTQFHAGPAMLTGPSQCPPYTEPWPTNGRIPDKIPITEKPVSQTQPMVPQQQQLQQPQQPPPPQPLQYAQISEQQSQPPQQQPPPPPPPQPPRSANQTSSYWSVPEQNEFPRLLELYGTDWQQIANGLKNKTAVMVKNYYHRSIESGKNEAWDSIAKEADDRIKHRRKLSNPPQPNPAPKRRFEPSPQGAPPRVLAPSTEMAEQVVEPSQGPSTAFAQLSPNHVAQTPPKIAPMPLPTVSNGPTLAQAPPPKASGTVTTNPKLAHSSRSYRQPQVAIAASLDGTRDPRPLIQAQPLASRQSEAQSEQSRVTVPQQQQQVLLQSPQKPQHQIRPGQHSHRSSIDLHAFTDATSRLHRERFEPSHQQMALSGLGPPSTPPHNVISQSFASDGRQVGQAIPDRVQVPLGTARESEKASKPNRQPIVSESSPPQLQRRDSVGPSSHTPTLYPIPPPPLPRTNIMSPPQDRPSSVPNNAPMQQPPAPPRPNPTPAKRSNIMSILNDDPPEPQPRRAPAETQSVTPAPPAQSAIPLPPYQQQPLQTQTSYPRQEQPIDSHRLVQHSQPTPSHQQRFSSKMSQPIRPQEQHIEQSIQLREQPPTNWPPSGSRPGFDQRLPYSNQPSHLYDQAMPLSVIQQQMMSTRPTSPPMMPSSANQRDSFAGLQSHPHSSRPQPGSNLGPAPSPYSQPTTHHSKLQPHPQQAQPPRAQPLYSHSPHQDTLNRQHQDPFQRHRDDARAHDAIRQQDYGRQEGYQHSVSMMREQEMRVAESVRQQQQQQFLQSESLRQQEDRRQQEAMRQNEIQQQHELRQRELRNQEAAMRHKEPMRPQQQAHPHQQPGLQYRESMRPQDAVRYEHSSRTFSPSFHGHGAYGPPPPQQQHPQHGQHPPPPPPPGQGQPGRGGYEDLR